ncbi:response regulator [Seonamhaeicola sp. NFXS20]
MFFKHLTNADGLSSNRINAIQEDGEGFIWFATGDGLNQFDGSTIEVFDEQVSSMVMHSKTKNLIVGTSSGLKIFDKNKRHFTNLNLENNFGDKLDSVQVNTLYYSSDNQLFVGGDSFCIINDSLTDFIKYQLPKDEKGRQWEITSIIETEKEEVLLGTKNGVWQLNIQTGKYSRVYQSDNLGIISKLFIDSESNLWICTYSKGIYFVKGGDIKSSPEVYNYERGFLINNRVIDVIEDKPQVFLIANIEGGLVRFDKNKKEVVFYEPDIHNVNSISGKALMTLMKDSQDNVWIGTYNSGVDFIDRHRKNFEHYQINFKKDGLFNNNIRALYEDSKGTIWVGTKEGGGLSKFNHDKGTFVHYKTDEKNPSSLGDDYVFCIEELDSKHLMIGTLKNGLEIFNTETGVFTHNVFNKKNSIYNAVYTIHKDLNDNIWIDYGGLFYQFFPESHTIEKIDGIVRVKCIIDEDENHIWLGTLETGLFLFNTQKKEIQKIKIQATEINALRKDSRGNLWVGTKEGLFFKKSNTSEFVSYTVKSGLANNQVLSLEVDNNDNVWAGTTNGLSKFDVKKQKFFNYDVHDGLQGNEFERYVSLKTKEGELIFGGRNGFNVFKPNRITENLNAPKVVITNFSLFNKPVAIGTENSPLKKHISQTKSLTLTHKQSVITFEFVALNYSSPEKNHYAYKLEGFDENWNYIGNKRTATYTNLPAGSYVFKVKASNSDGFWNTNGASVNVTVLQPWWKTPYAFLIYLIIIILLLAIFYYFLYTYLDLKNDLKLEQIEKQNNKELHQAKLQFFTNISHEFRTPLTLIINPLERLLSSNKNEENLTRQLKLIHANADRLLRLINQLMDFRKIEKGKMTLKVSKCNIVEITKNIAKSFVDKAEESSINFKVISSKPEVFVYLDIEKYDIILHNLLFNAFKFTKDYGNISVEICLRNKENNHFVEIRVKDDGKGISEDSITQIFEEFYQEEQGLKGTGIGLSLTKKLIELHKGTIEVESALEKGSCFIITLPLDEAHFNSSDVYELSKDYTFKDNLHKPSVQETIKSKRVLNGGYNKNKTIKILLVEDNEELRSYLKESLESQYVVYESNNGAEGIKTCLKISPDLIISDVMMPVKDGVEMCYDIKTDIRISHIPIILLTARTSLEHKIEGLKTGADAYLEKPFKMELLETQIANLIESRRRLRKRFGNDINLELHEISNSSADDKFLNKARKIVEEHLLDTEFSVEDFIKEMGMSRSSLHVKLKALTSKSTTEFIRAIRLKKAAIFLKETNQTISEIAYKTGFASPAYFSKSFKKLFGKLPTDYRNE